MSKILANQIANYGDDAPIEIKEGLSIPTGKPIQAAGDAGTNGQVLTSTGSSIQWTTPFDGNYNSLTNKPTIPAAQVNSDWNSSSGLSRILNKPTVPPLPSVTTNAPGTAALTYNSVNGQFTYTPPDVSSFATSVDLSTAVANSSNWDTAYSWGNHAAAGYLTAEADTLATVVARGSTISTGSVTFNNNVKARFGTSQTLDIYSNGFSNIIESTNFSTRIYTNGDQFRVMSTGSGPNYLSVNPTGNGEVQLYYGGEAKLETTTEGVTITGSVGNNNLQVDGDALVIGGLTAGGLSYPEVTGTAGQVLTSDGAGNVVWSAASGGGSGIALTDLSVTTNAAGSAALSYNNISGVFTYTPPDLSSYAQTANLSIANWDAAYGWGNHATRGYLTSLGDAAGVTSAKIANWDTAYGWGNHASAGYLTAYTETQTLDDVLTLGATTTQDITTTGRVYYSNQFPLLTDLQAVSASTYHGMFAHAHDTGHGYVAHAGGWIQLLDTGSELSELSNVTTTSPSTNDVLTWDGANWGPAAPTGGAGSANVTISDTSPGAPNAGDLWWESDTGRLKIYYQDVDSSQWVDTNPPLALQNNLPVVVGCITLNGTSPTWTGTSGYTVSGAQPGGAGTDYEITLTFPSAYSARTDYIVQATYDGTNYVSGSDASIGVARGTASVVFTPRRWDENPLSLGEIMVTITNL